MKLRLAWWTVMAGLLFLISKPLCGAEVTVDGGPMDAGFNSGALAYIHATVRGLSGQPKRYVVFAEIQYYGTTSSTSVEMDRLPEMKPGVEEFQVGWPIPPQAPTGLYTLVLHVEDRIQHLPEIRQKVRGFVVYSKQVRISRVTLDKTIYNVGDPIKCEVGIENLSDVEVKGLRVEFSNANYPWISLFSQKGHDNPDLAIRLLRDHLDVPAGNAVTLPMVAAGTAAFLSGKQRDVMGAGASLGNEKIPPPEVDTYTVALWNADRTKLYDMQFSPQVIVRTWDRSLPKPYSRDYTHPYNSYIDYAKYREFYPPGYLSSAVRVDNSQTLYRPGDTVRIAAIVKNPMDQPMNNGSLWVRITDMSGKEVYKDEPVMGINLAAGAKEKVAADAWRIPPGQTPGTYRVALDLARSEGKILVEGATTEIAVNELPASLLVICAHEDDDQAYSGLMRAAVEAKIPVHLLTLTAGDVGECERYFGKPCGPNEAREFGTVRMEETAEVLEHLGISRDHFIDLGLPDGGSGEIWFNHRDSSHPFLSIYLACDHAPYDNVYKPNLPYARDAVVEAIRQVITNLNPAMIALTGPDERHVDHRTANWFAIKACQALLKQKAIDPGTIVLADQVYGAGGFKPAPYKYENFVVHLSGEAAALRQEASWIYQSQDGNLAEGDMKTFAELSREEKHLRIMDWQEHEGWNEEAVN